MDAPGFLTGQMLIAMPGIGDPRFERALLLVCAHDATHAMALAVNRPLDGVTVPELLRRLDIGAGGSLSDDPVLLGGPVERERGFVVHTADYEARDDNTLRISDNLALTATRDVLEALVSPQGRPRRAQRGLGLRQGASGGGGFRVHRRAELLALMPGLIQGATGA